MIVSVHIADVGVRRARKALKAPKPGAVAGLLRAYALTCSVLADKRIPPLQLGRVALVSAWKDDKALDVFHQTNPYAQLFRQGFEVRLTPVRAHGSWADLPELERVSGRLEAADPVAVLTLARANRLQTLRFLRFNAAASGAFAEAPGAVWGTGASTPGGLMASFSLWQTVADLEAYSKGGADTPHHAAVIDDARKPFHRENVFVRFRPYRSAGSLSGTNPLDGHRV